MGNFKALDVTQELELTAIVEDERLETIGGPLTGGSLPSAGAVHALL